MGLVRTLRWSNWLCAALLALSLACGSPGAARLSLGGQSSPPQAPRGELRVSLRGEPVSIDPSLFSSTIGYDVVAELFSPLVRFDSLGNVVPDVAKEVPTLGNGGVSSDGKTVTFYLREDAVWSDGRPLTADDFVYSVRRSLDPRLGGRRMGFLFAVQGAEAYATALARAEQPRQVDSATLDGLAEAVGIRALNSSTLVVELSHPPQLLLFPFSFPRPVRRDVVELYGNRWTEAGHLIGNGPFVLSEWVHNRYLTLVPNPRYHGAKPRVAKLTFLIMEPELAWREYQAGKLELAEVPSGSRAPVLANPTLASELIRANKFSTDTLWFNPTRPHFDNLKVRQALARAIDRGELVKALEGMGMPATSWLPPGVPGHDPGLGKPGQAFDPAAARRLFAEAGYAGGRGFPKISLSYVEEPRGGQGRVLAEFVGTQLKANLGIDLTPEPEDSATLERRTRSGDFDLAAGSFTFPGDPSRMELFASLNSQNGNRYYQYRSPRFDRAVASALDEIDPARQLVRWQEAHRIFVDDNPGIFLIHNEELWLRQPYLQGLVSAIHGNIPGSGFLSQAWIDKS